MSGVRASRVSCARVAPRVRVGVSSVSVLRENKETILCWQGLLVTCSYVDEPLTWIWAGPLLQYLGLLFLFLGTSCAISDRVFQQVLCIQSPLLSTVCSPYYYYYFCVRVTCAHFVCM